MNDLIQLAKAQLPLPELMARLGLASHAKPSALSPFRDEKNPSFGIFHKEGGAWCWKDHGTGEHGDEIDFVAKLHGLSQADALKWYTEVAGVRPALGRSHSFSVVLEPSRIIPPRAVAHPATVTASSGPPPASSWPTWTDAVAHFPDHAAQVAHERGLSVEFLMQLNQHSLIGWVTGPAFPVFDSVGEVVSAHHRHPVPAGQRARWDFTPPLRTIPARLTALVVGDPATARDYHILESQWDMLALMERMGWHAGEAESACFICTRGASNGGLVEGLLVPERDCIIWPQNDTPKAGGVVPSEEWFNTVRGLCSSCRVFRARTPAPHKDLNDWVKAGATMADLLRAAISGRVLPFAITFRTVREILDMRFDNSDNYLGDRAIAAGQPTTLLGPGGVGKSRLTLQLAICMITDRPFLDMIGFAKSKKWLFIQTENSTRRLQHDLRKMIDSMKLRPDEITLMNECLIIHTLETDADTILLLEGGADYAQVDAAIQHYQPDFVVFDPLNTFTALDLNKDQDMRTVLSLITRLVRKGDPNRVPFIIHHSLTGKAGAAKATGWDKGSFGRNSKVLNAWCRSQMNLAPANPDDPTRLVLVHGKSNNGVPFTDTGVKFDEDKGLYEVDPDFDPEEYRQAVGLTSASPRKMHIPPLDVARLIDCDGITKAHLVKAIQDEHGCAKARAYEAIDEAVAAGTIHRPTNGGKARRADLYTVCGGKP